METKPARIFLTYFRKDIGLVNELYEKLSRYGFSLWQDHRDIISEKWLDAIKKAMKLGIEAAVKVSGVNRISAGNYGGKLGKFQYKLHELGLG